MHLNCLPIDSCDQFSFSREDVHRESAGSMIFAVDF